MQKILKAPTLIGIRRAVLEYSFENFTIYGKKKNGKVQNRTLPFYMRSRYFIFSDVGLSLVTNLSIYRLYPLSRITSTTLETYF